MTWTDYQQNKKVEFLTGIFTFHLLPKILSRINSNNLRWRLKVRAQRKSPCFNSRCIMDWNVSSLSHVWTFLNMMNRKYLVQNFQVLYNWLFRNFQFSNFNFFSSVWIMIEVTLSNSILDGLGMMFLYVTSLKSSQTFSLKWGASSWWPFGPNYAWGSIETVTIGKTHPILGWVAECDL